MKEGKRSYKFVIFLAIIAVVAGIFIVGTILFTNSRDNSYKIVNLMNTATETPTDFKYSSLNLYNNGTFDVELIYYNSNLKIKEKRFVGIGTYKKGKDIENKDAYLFTFLDAYTFPGGTETKRLDYIEATEPYKYRILSNDRIRFEWQGNFYTFGR